MTQIVPVTQISLFPQAPANSNVEPRFNVTRRCSHWMIMIFPKIRLISRRVGVAGLRNYVMLGSFAAQSTLLSSNIRKRNVKMINTKSLVNFFGLAKNVVSAPSRREQVHYLVDKEFGERKSLRFVGMCPSSFFYLTGVTIRNERQKCFS